ncbi:hypothetical protein HO173_009685 [Letharia columbiana]|uniref:Uncharacterized protein n=1 Tax=Letharia columbiana TaxID=112416 RepID=A0A8H6FP23_9LECA|nr:uncharacterized protein HO173_009685 [Letharia columbiana]KAF6232091.1 hypothetical protein HO173_009685 [Letharia columbiana]
METVNVWLPEELKLEAQIRNWILGMPEVWLRRIALPTVVSGARIEGSEHQVDVVRLKILYEEGGSLQALGATGNIH